MMKEDEKKLEELLDELISKRREETDALKKLIDSIHQGEEINPNEQDNNQQVKKSKRKSEPNI